MVLGIVWCAQPLPPPPPSLSLSFSGAHFHFLEEAKGKRKTKQNSMPATQQRGGGAQAMPRGGRRNGINLNKSKQMFVTLGKGFPEDGGQQRGSPRMRSCQRETLSSSHIFFPGL